MESLNGYWKNSDFINPTEYTCGYCGNQVGSNQGFIMEQNNLHLICICPRCTKPSFLTLESSRHIVVDVVPGKVYGETIEKLPDDVSSIYDEARKAYSVGAYTGVILIGRKVLANTAIYFGAKDGQNFVSYVDYLLDNGYVPEKSKDWIDTIRTDGNKATHDKTAMNQENATKIMGFVQMLLIINFKFNTEYQKQIEE